MVEPVMLFGKSLSITVAPGADAVVDTISPVISAAVEVLNSQQAQLNPTMLQYIGALRGFGIAMERSFTPLPDTADADLGVYVYFFGAIDINANKNPLWYASTIIHDGGHAWLSQQGEVAIGVPVEQALVQVQLDYYNIVGDPENYIATLQSYEADQLAILHRIGEPVEAANV